MLEDDYPITEAMTRYGGSFVQALAEAARRADPTNLAKLKHAFPEYWTEYREMASWPVRQSKTPEDR